jgi:hypothetical protein
MNEFPQTLLAREILKKNSLERCKVFTFSGSMNLRGTNSNAHVPPLHATSARQSLSGISGTGTELTLAAKGLGGTFTWEYRCHDSFLQDSTAFF